MAGAAVARGDRRRRPGRDLPGRGRPAGARRPGDDAGLDRQGGGAPPLRRRRHPGAAVAQRGHGDGGDRGPGARAGRGHDPRRRARGGHRRRRDRASSSRSATRPALAAALARLVADPAERDAAVGRGAGALSRALQHGGLHARARRRVRRPRRGRRGRAPRPRSGRRDPARRLLRWRCATPPRRRSRPSQDELDALEHRAADPSTLLADRRDLVARGRARAPADPRDEADLLRRLAAPDPESADHGPRLLGRGPDGAAEPDDRGRADALARRRRPGDPGARHRREAGVQSGAARGVLARPRPGFRPPVCWSPTRPSRPGRRSTTWTW